MRKTVEYIFFVAALQKQKEHKSETSHKDVTILLVGTGVLDGPLAQDLICRKQIDNPDRFQCLSGLYLICSTNWNLTLSQFENLFLYYFFAPSTLVAFRALQVSSRSSVHRIKCLLIGRYDLVATIFALVSTHADFKL